MNLLNNALARYTIVSGTPLSLVLSTSKADSCCLCVSMWDTTIVSACLSLSILQGLPASFEGEVVECLSSSVKKMVSAHGARGNDRAVKVVEYLEILMENFSLGEAAVSCQAPIGT